MRNLFCVLLFLSLCLSVRGQSLDDAKNWYLEGRYADALPVFQREYENKPNDASLNQWLGVSLYETGNLPAAGKYLLFASQKRIPEAYIYLGAWYATVYRFEDAEKEFEKYQRAKRRDSNALEALAEKRQYAERLKRAVNHTEDVQIIDSLIVPKSDFLSAYHLSASSGSLMPLSRFFNNLPPTDKTLHINEREDKVYYSKGEGSTESDLYTMEKLLDTFGNEKKLPESVNADGSQAYPFVMPDGLTIYFASTGYQSFGGYDLYITRYNLATDSYLTPNQLNMPFNSPFNDYMMAVDEEKGIGWFASDRFQPADSVCVYTFIPNQRVTLVESDDEDYKTKRAIITAISDTWKEGTDYASLRVAARQKRSAATEQDSKGDFAFVINDNVTYYTLSDFRSIQALSLFSQALALETQLNNLQSELSGKRDQFAGGGSTNQTLRSSILDLEKQTESMLMELERLKLQARNEEIRANDN